MKTVITLAIVSTLACSACATAPDRPPSAPDYSAVPTQAPTPNARLYAACLEQAAAADAYRRAHNGDGAEYILFTCTGAPAAAFATALIPWSEKIGSTFQRDGRTFRSTAKVEANLFGVDSCSTDQTGGDAICILSFNAGDFLDQ
ncbi:hypothetical protein QE419_001933 [Brevundimonas vesicularis]|uniref:hypothetical protein n=1 Tax=Brevundimonas vesicularis TaxID=41276 RepID=UPI002781A9C3|nr:hypothetical protein [Brevundimonas vesicularis]MDQ1193167.1 hypothetical protein [Brevundimonas vesicularis]